MFGSIKSVFHHCMKVCNFTRAICLNIPYLICLQIEEQREYVQKVCREGEDEFGLPLSVIPKQPVSINLSRYVTISYATFANAAGSKDQAKV